MKKLWIPVIAILMGVICTLIWSLLIFPDDKGQFVPYRVGPAQDEKKLKPAIVEVYEGKSHRVTDVKMGEGNRHELWSATGRTKHW